MLGVGVRLVKQHSSRVGIIVVAGAGPAQIHRQRYQSLLRAIVQIAFDPTSLGFGGVDDAGATALERIDALRELRGTHTEQRLRQRSLGGRQSVCKSSTDNTNDDAERCYQPSGALIADGERSAGER